MRGVFADHLHQPFRAKLIPFLPLVIAAAEKAGALGAFLSGSGSTIAAVTVNSSKKIAVAMAHAAKTPGRTIITHADNLGAKILQVANYFSLITILHGPPSRTIEEFGIDVVLGRRHGIRASVLRGILYALSFVYDRVVQLRLYLYRKRVLRERALGCLVISIGNLTVAGRVRHRLSRSLPVLCRPVDGVLRF